MPEYTDAQLDAAVEALSDPEKLEEAQRLVASTAPQLQGILNQALESADWFGSAHQAEVLRAAGVADPDERIAAVRTLIAEETRVSMLIGVAVGYELARQLDARRLNELAVDIRFLGHAAVELTSGDVNVLIDPFITGNPKATVEASELEPTHIFLTHGHRDHYGDIVDIAKRTGATVVALTEIAGELEEQGVENVHNPNFGGTVTFDWGWVKLVPACPHLDDAQRHGHPAGRPARSTSAARSSTTSATRRCSPTCS